MAVNERLNDFADIAAATQQFDYLQTRIEQYVKQMDEASKMAKLSFDGLQGAKNMSDLNKGANEAAVANKKMADSVKEYAKAVADTTGFLSHFSNTMQQNIKLQYQEEQQLKAIKKELFELSKSTTDYTKRIGELKSEELALKSSMSERRIALNQEQKEMNAAAGSADEMAIRLGRLRDTYRQLTQAERESEFGLMMVEDIQKLDAEIKKVDASLGNFQRNVGNYPNATAELASIRQELIKLRLEGKEGTEQFQTMSARAKELGVAISDVNRSTSITSGTVNITSGTFQKASNAAQSFQQVLRETPAAGNSFGTYISAISNNIPILVEHLKELSAANKVAKLAGEQTVPVWKVLGSSLLSLNGVATLVVSTVTLLAMKTDVFKSSADEAAKSAKDLADRLKEVADNASISYSKQITAAETLLAILDDVNVRDKTKIEAFKELQKLYPQYLGNLTAEQALKGEARRYLDIIEEEIGLKTELEAIEETTNVLLKERMDLQKKANELRDNTYQFGIIPKDNTEERTAIEQKIAEIDKQIEESRKKIKDYKAAVLSFPASNAVGVGGRTKAEIEKEIVAAEKLRDTTAATTTEHRQALNILIKLNIEMEAYLGRSRKERNGSTIVEGLHSIYLAEKRNREAVLMWDLQQARLQQQQSKLIYDDETQSLDDRLEAYRQYQQAVIQEAIYTNSAEMSITEDKLNELKELRRQDSEGTIKLNKYQLKVMEIDFDTYTLKLNAQKQSLQTKLTEITAKGIVEEQGIRDSAAATQAEKSRKFIAEEMLQLEDRIADYEDMYAKESVVISQSYLDKEISEKTFQLKMRDLRIKYADIELQARISEDEFLLKQDGFTAEQRLQIQRRLNKEIQQLNDNRVAAAKAVPNNPFGLTDEQMQRGIQLSQQAVELERALSDLSSQRAQNEINALERKKQALSETSNAEIAAIEKSLISEEEKEKRIAGVKAQAAAQEKAYTQQQNALKRKQAINDKAAAAAAVIQQTTVAVMSALKLPPPFGQILAGAIGITGGLQLAKVLATEIPAYAEGTPEGGHPKDGYALVGEEYKPELILDGGKASVVSSPTIMNLSKGARVIPQDKVMQDMENMINFLPASLLRMLLVPTGGDTGGVALSMEQLEQTLVAEGRATREAIKNKTETYFNWSNGEMIKTVRNGNNWTTYIHRQNN